MSRARGRHRGGPDRGPAHRRLLRLRIPAQHPERKKLAELRDFLAAEIAPYAGDWWNNAEFPAHILPKLAALELSAPAQRGYSHLFAGLVIAEMTRVDTSIATFFLVHHDLFVESLYGFGSEEQKARLLDDAAALRTTGAFALTEPEHGSDVAGGMETVARRVPAAADNGLPDGGEHWVLNGAKRWIGNGTFCDYMLVWARDEADGAIRGFIVDATLPGVSRSRIEHKIALRTVQNADIVFTDVLVRPRRTGSPASAASRTPTSCCAAHGSWWPGRPWASSWRRSTSPGSTPSNASSSAGRWPSSSSSSSSW